MPDSFTIATFSGATAVVLAIIYLNRRNPGNPKGLPLPPGPKRLPVVGNLYDIPSGASWHVYKEWAKKYGDVTYISVLGSPILVLNTWKSISELMDKRAKYADRPDLIMAGELMGYHRVVSVIPYGERWRKYRKLLHTSMHKGAVSQYWPVQEQETRLYLRRLLDKPETFIEEFKLATGRIIMKTVYGVQADSPEHPYIVDAEEGMENLVRAVHPGAFLVDMFPLLRYVPAWFPGAGFKHKAEEWKKVLTRMVDSPFNHVKEELAKGIAPSSFTADALEGDELEGDPDREDIIKWAAGTMYGAGTDTTGSSMTTFFLLMVLHPDIQKIAQAEIDKVIGTQRLPGFEDRPDLPYVECLMKEVMRWYPVTPLGVGRKLSEDDYYNGYYHPKGSVVLANIWAMTKDPANYPDPERFWPGRFLPENGGDKLIDPYDYVFGFGRRICAGQHFGSNSLWIAIASVLASYDISKPLDANGKEVEPHIAWTDGVISHPEKFKCTLRPRSEAALKLIRSS